jgi:hypothetical protein
MSHTGEWIGVDISKRFLDVYVASEPAFRLANDDGGRSMLTERLRTIGVRGVVLEATGGLERPVLAALTAAELPGSIVNPARVRAFAEGTAQIRPYLAAFRGITGHANKTVATIANDEGAATHHSAAIMPPTCGARPSWRRASTRSTSMGFLTPSTS